jgi:glycosyltransferase involved in cell wall biosynthesis
MINPMYHKGRSYMADIVNDYGNKWTYRVLLGGYGGQKEEFMSMIADSWAVRDGRIEILPYVERMEDVWESTDLFIFPSRFEGYGMAAVEPMVHGVPVMVQDYPSVREAVGDGAIIMPYGCDSREWVETIEELFFDDEDIAEIRAKGYERVDALRHREEEQISDLVDFLVKL